MTLPDWIAALIFITGVSIPFLIALGAVIGLLYGGIMMIINDGDYTGVILFILAIILVVLISVCYVTVKGEIRRELTEYLNRPGSNIVCICCYRMATREPSVIIEPPEIEVSVV